MCVSPPQVSAISIPSGTQYGAYTVSFPASSGATSYILQESRNGAAWQTVPHSNRAANRPFVGGNYRYRVRADNACGNRGWTESGTVAVRPSKPASISTPATSTNGNISVSWDATQAGNTYELRRQKKIGSSWSTTGVWTGLSGSSKSFTNYPDGTHRHVVRACNGGYCSGWEYSGAFLVEYPPATPTGLSTPDHVETRMFEISWNAVGNALSYDVERQFQGGSWKHIANTPYTELDVYVTQTGTYGFRVRANRTVTESDWSSTVETFVFLGGFGCTVEQTDVQSAPAQESGGTVTEPADATITGNAAVPPGC